MLGTYLQLCQKKNINYVELISNQKGLLVELIRSQKISLNVPFLLLQT